MANQIYQFDGFVLDQNRRQLFFADKPVFLSAKAFDIFSLLVEKSGKIVGKDEIFEKIWANNFVEESNLPVQISALRKILKNESGTEFIKTVSGRGYSFTALVQILDSVVETRSNILATQKTVSHSIAVLPFILAKESADLSYISVGITQSLIENLSQIAELKVLAYSAVRQYQTAARDVQDIGFLLGATKILTGEITEYKNKLEINAELIEVKDRTHIWGLQQIFEYSDVFEVKKEISLRIAEKLKIQLSEANRSDFAKSSAFSFEAQKLYFRGVSVLESRIGKGNVKETLRRAINYFQQAIDIEPKYAAAYVGIGMAFVSLYNHVLIDKEEAYLKSNQALQSSLAADENFSQAYVLKASIGVFFTRSYAESHKSLDKAIELNPNNPDAYHWKGLIYTHFGQFEQALAMENKALQFDPVSPRFNSQLFRISYFAGDYHKAVVQAEELLELTPNAVDCLLFLAQSYAALGLFEKAVEEINKAIAVRKTPEMILVKAVILAMADKKKEAGQIIFDVFRDYEETTIDSVHIATVYATLGQIDRAFEMLEKAFVKGSTDLNLLKIDKKFQNLRQDPRYDFYLKKLNLV